MISKLVKLWRLLNYLDIDVSSKKVTFFIKGVSISFNEDNDLEVIIPGSYIQRSKYSFTNCDDEFIKEVKEGVYLIKEEECLVQQD